MGIEWWLEAQVWVHVASLPPDFSKSFMSLHSVVSAQWWWVEPIVIKFHIHLLSMFSWQWFEVTQASANLSLCVPVSGPVSQPPPSKKHSCFLCTLFPHRTSLLIFPGQPYLPPLNPAKSSCGKKEFGFSTSALKTEFSFTETPPPPVYPIQSHLQRSHIHCPSLGLWKTKYA